MESSVVLVGGALGFSAGYGLLTVFWRSYLLRNADFDLGTLFFYMAVSFPLSLLFEIGFGIIDQHLFDRTLWQYRVFPVHRGFTSLLNFGVWPLYGMNFYFFEKYLSASSFTQTTKKILTAGKFAFSGPLLEMVTNLLCILLFGRYYFYYYPGDLWHLTSIQVVPYYIVFSMALSYAIGKLRRVKHRALVGCLLYCFGLALLFVR